MFHARNLARFYVHSIHNVNSATKYSTASTSLWTSLRKFASTPALQEENPVNEDLKATSKEPSWIRNRNDSAIFKAENKNDLFDAIKSKKFTPNNAVFAVNTLSRWIAEGKLVREEIVSSEELKTIEESIKLGNISVNVSQMIQAIKNLVALGINPSSATIDSLENEILWNMRKSKLSYSFQVLEFQSKFLHSDLQRKVLEEAQKNIQLRWVELKEAQEFITVFQTLIFKSDPKFLDKVENHILTFVETFSQDEKAKILITLGNNKRRPTPLLQALCYHMNRTNDTLSVRKSVDLLYALSQLSFADHSLLERLCNDLANQPVEKLTPGNISSVSSSLGQLKYRHEGLLQLFCELVHQDVDKCRIQTITSLISCLGAVNFTPSNWEALSDQVVKRLMQSVNEFQEKGRQLIWLNVVWSLVSLKVVSPQLIQSVLHRQFINQIWNTEGDKPVNPVIALKLNQLWFMSQLSNIEVLELPLEMPLKVQLTDPKRTATTDLRKSVLEAITSLVPAPKYLKTNTTTPLGIDMDGEFILNASGVPASFDAEIAPSQFRMALLILNYKDTCLGTSYPVGLQAFREHLLSLSGYTVVRVSHSDFYIKEKLLKRVQILETLMKTAISQRRDVS